MKILAVDPGEKRLGLALSDETGALASPLAVLKHSSRLLDAATIADLARQNQAGLIVIGQSLDDDGSPTPSSRRATRLAHAIQQQCDIPLALWDESYSTREARQSQVEMGTRRHKRRGHLDDLAAAVILQSYLDARKDH